MHRCRLVRWVLLGLAVIALAETLASWALFPGWRRTPGHVPISAPPDVARALLACMHTVQDVRRAKLV